MRNDRPLADERPIAWLFEFGEPGAKAKGRKWNEGWRRFVGLEGNKDG